MYVRGGNIIGGRRRRRRRREDSPRGAGLAKTKPKKWRVNRTGMSEKEREGLEGLEKRSAR